MSNYAFQVFKTIPSRKGFKKAIKRGEVLVNESVATTGDWVLPGQKIELLERELVVGKVFPLKLEVLFEDEYLGLIKKPAGYPTSGNYFKTIQNALPHNLKKSVESDALAVPLPVHRLDAATSGLLLIAKTISTRIDLGKQFEEKTIQKKYRAIVVGKTPKEGSINFDIEGKKALTEYIRLHHKTDSKNNSLTELELTLKTGRTHQLRIHLSKLGFPILGDKIYGTEGQILKGKGLFLCATSLSFRHPKTLKELHFEISPPNKFNRVAPTASWRSRKDLCDL